jgi:hypothetical protein
MSVDFFADESKLCAFSDAWAGKLSAGNRGFLEPGALSCAPLLYRIKHTVRPNVPLAFRLRRPSPEIGSRALVPGAARVQQSLRMDQGGFANLDTRESDTR